MLHLLIQVFPFLHMFKIGDKCFHRSDNIFFFCFLVIQYRLQSFQESIQFFHPSGLQVFNHSQRSEAFRINFFPLHVKFLKPFFSCRIRGEIIHRIYFTIHRHLRGKPPGFLLRGTLLHLISQTMQEPVGDRGEGHHLLFSQFREKDLPVLSQDAGQHTDLSTLLRRNEIAFHIVRRTQRLTLHQPADKSGQQTSVRKSHIGKTGRRYFEPRRIGHDHFLHDLLAGSHDIYRIGRLIRRHAEEMTRRKFR